MSRIAGRFEELARAGRKALIPYIVAGDPDLASTVPLMHALVENGADIIELGVPFSDPMSEGPVIQQAHERALAGGTSLRDALEVVRTFREKDTTTPVLLMGYANPVEHMGYAAFADAAAAVGLDALLTVDIPPEEVEQVNAELHRVGMDNIFLVAPTTPEARIARIVAQASGFIYYVSLKGVTGAGHLDTVDVAEHVARIRAASALPVAVGFGIRDADSAASVASVADGVVVGSALIRAMADALDGGADHAAAGAVACALLADIRAGVDRAAS
ncbi:tryptophan synthase subunit alpha [Mangrovimicrobium sediminis]|uniref:Tryptophan synthase alpha chain n=1 Tax=Mangrovimicrobium sediminis TaxID=2562682 RepID=A0A4Z0LW64_9GAMM|nr:tryptophan synthase subunit alpha [Haliea sp. SAOS-164]TGD71396.1 tryptophan synthase subunit alpha [Haliea sp. SAOS-164]